MSSEFKNIQNYIFDMDGTLIDSSGDIINSLKAAYEISEIEYDKTLLQVTLIGPPIKEIIGKISPSLEETEVDLVIKNFRTIYDSSNFEQTHCYENMIEILSDLKNLEKKIFITTNKPLIPTKKILNKFKMDFFDDVITVDLFDGKKLSKHEMIEILIQKWNLERTQTVIIGDSTSDIKAGIASQIKTIAALYGYETGLENFSDTSIKSITELKNICA